MKTPRAARALGFGALLASACLPIDGCGSSPAPAARAPSAAASEQEPVRAAPETSGDASRARTLLDSLPEARLDGELPESVLQSSAPGIFGSTVGTWMSLSNFLSTGADEPEAEASACPRVLLEENRQIIEGECDGAQGRVHGRAVYERSPQGERWIFEGFGADTPDGSLRMAGVVESTRREGEGGGEETKHFDVYFETDHGQMAYVYDAIVTYDAIGAPGEARSVWRGQGRVGISGFGWFHTSTEEEILDKTVCATEATSGRTRISASGESILIEYDGASDCDEASTVRVTQAGQTQEREGIACRIGRRRGPEAPLLVGLIASLWLLRRRRSSP